MNYDSFTHQLSTSLARGDTEQAATLIAAYIDALTAPIHHVNIGTATPDDETTRMIDQLVRGGRIPCGMDVELVDREESAPFNAASGMYADEVCENCMREQGREIPNGQAIRQCFFHSAVASAHNAQVDLAQALDVIRELVNSQRRLLGIVKNAQSFGFTELADIHCDVKSDIANAEDVNGHACMILARHSTQEVAPDTLEHAEDIR